MRLHLRRPSKSATFTLLMLLALLASLLPTSWTSWKRGLAQLLGPAQWTVRTALGGGASRTSWGGASDEVARLRAENEEWQRLARQQELWLEDVRQRLDEVCGLRGQMSDVGAAILIAPVLGFDASPRRETLLIGRGSVDQVRPGQWVAAGWPPGQQPAGEGGRQLLSRQWLVGRISEVRTRVSRVLLASDPNFGEPRAGEPVCVARVLRDGRWQPTSPKYVLTGRGRGKMVISRADADLSKEGYEVVLVPAGPELPMTLTIGRIISSSRLAESALHYDLEVAPWGDPHGLRYVYVIQVGT